MRVSPWLQAVSEFQADRKHLPGKHHHSPSTCCYPWHMFLPDLLLSLARSFLCSQGNCITQWSQQSSAVCINKKHRVKRTLSLEKSLSFLCPWSQQDEEQLFLRDFWMGYKDFLSHKLIFQLQLQITYIRQQLVNW